MATSQDFVNWVCGEQLSSRYLMYLLMSEQETIRRLASGTTHQTMYYPDAKAFWVCVPERRVQEQVAALLGALDEKIDANGHLAAASEKLAVQLVARLPDRCPVRDVVSSLRNQLKPMQFADEVVDHFSLPAFDSGKLPERCSGTTIKSNKFQVRRPAVLISKLNPHIPRVWYAEPSPGKVALASTEFVVLEPSGTCSPTVLWAACAVPSVISALAERVTGTTGSHQRVRPEDVMEVLVPDVAGLSSNEHDLIDALVLRASAARRESQVLAALRDALLPPLMSGELRVRDAEAWAGEVL